MRRNTRRIRIAVALYLAGLPAIAAAAGLADIVRLARSSDAAYAMAIASTEAGREKRIQGRAGLLPTVSLTANQRYNRDLSATAVAPREYDSRAWTVSVTQPLWRKANLDALELGELQALLAEQQLRLAEQDLLLRVAKAYFDVLQAQDALSALGAQKAAFAQQLAQATRAYEVGLAPITDVNEAKARHDLTAAQEIAAGNDLEVKRRTLEKSIDRELPALAGPDAEALVEPLPSAEAQALAERAAQDALRVAIGVTGERIAQREAQRQRAAHQPSLDLVASHGRTRNANFSLFGPTDLRQSAIGVEFALPIYQGGAIDSRVREALAMLERARQELTDARRQAKLDGRQALLGVQSGVALQQALREALRSAQEQVRSTRRGFEVGLRSRVDVLNAEQQLHATRRDLAASRYQTLMAALQLKAAAGVLGDDAIAAIDAMLRE